jgi:23S rRNA U2552 (ribose-2'-O)-methylase RlmE/FtsJ
MSSYILNDFINIVDSSHVLVLYDTQSKQVTSSNNFCPKYKYINESLRNYLHNIKKEIDNKVDEWEKYKKYSNTYEYINTNFTYKDSYTTVCAYKPISRSFYKMIEILNHNEFNFDNRKIKSFHLAEGPGGFIEALVRTRHNKNDTYYGMTLMQEHKDIPRWKKASSFLSQNRNVKLVYGPQGDGNLYLKHNLMYIYENFHHNIDFITADGGFDFSTDFNAQEESSLNLIVCEVLYAIIMQKKGGSFVLKVFDCFSNVMMELLFLLSYLYDEVSFTKPCTSRAANSEKYVICKGFRMVDNIDQIIKNMGNNFINMKEKQIMKILNIDISDFFKNKLEEINYLFGQQQIENISHTLNFINDNVDDERLERIKHQNIYKCTKWCKKYNMPINSVINEAYESNS